MSLGRERLSWADEIWAAIDEAVHNEVQRTSVAARFIPLHSPAPPPEVATVPADLIDSSAMTVDEVAVIPVVELGVEFRLSRQQVGNEADAGTAVSLATRAANILARAEDTVLFQGEDAFSSPVFKNVTRGGGSAGLGLLQSAAQAVTVDPIAAGKYGQNTFTSFANAYSQLQEDGHYGPYALALRSEVYADTYFPLPATLVMTADSIKPMVPLGFYGTGTLPASTGILISAGGNTVDLVASVDPITEFLQVDPDGYYRFKVYERFALRVKNRAALIRFEFKEFV